LLETWAHPPVRRLFSRYAEQAQALARRLGKGEIEVAIDATGVRLPAETLAPFWTIFAHLLRNAVDHGLETPAERLQTGKAGPAALTLRCRLRAKELSIEVHDNGHGIDWQRVGARATQAGLRADTHADLIEALVADGFTTCDQATEVSGRGVGLSAVRAACVQTGGTMHVLSELGRGTTFQFAWPVDKVGLGGAAAGDAPTLLGEGA
jgi:two-component system chemotaxis sensor kinase CheA